MKKLCRILLILVAIVGILFLQSQVHASPIVLDSNNTTTNTAGGNVASGNNTTNPVNNTTNPVNNTVNNTSNKVNSVTNTLPKTGIEDSPAGIFMVIGIISAIYAYKKIREYNA